MAKRIIFEIDDKLNEKLRLYINKNYPLEPYGKVKQIITDAISEYLENHSGTP